MSEDASRVRRSDETEAIVLGRLMKLGVSISIPFGDSNRYDLIADDGTRLYRIHCKTGNWVNGSVKFSLYTSTENGDERANTDDAPEEVDGYAVYSYETEEVYWVPTDETGTGEMRLRVESPHRKAPKSKINWADEYLLSNQF